VALGDEAKMRKVEGPVKHALLSKGKDARGSFDVERIRQFGPCTEKKEARMASYGEMVSL